MNKEKLSYDLVIERISKGVYDVTNYDVKYLEPKPLLKDTDIIDEDKSVRWNRKQIVLENEKIRSYNWALKEAKNDGPREFESDLKEAIMNEHGLNANQANKVYRKAYEDGHSAGEREVLWEAMELGELVEDILKLA